MVSSVKLQLQSLSSMCSHFSELPKGKSWLLDGYPSTLDQAIELDKGLSQSNLNEDRSFDINLIILLEQNDEEEILRRYGANVEKERLEQLTDALGKEGSTFEQKYAGKHKCSL